MQLTVKGSIQLQYEHVLTPKYYYYCWIRPTTSVLLFEAILVILHVYHIHWGSKVGGREGGEWFNSLLYMYAHTETLVFNTWIKQPSGPGSNTHDDYMYMYMYVLFIRGTCTCMFSIWGWIVRGNCTHTMVNGQCTCTCTCTQIRPHKLARAENRCIKSAVSQPVWRHQLIRFQESQEN